MNSTAKIPFALALTAVVAACTSSAPPPWTRGPYVKPGLIMLTADQAERRGIAVGTAAPASPPMPADVNSLDASAVTVPAGIKVYALNRAADPADPELMHEQHVVYRRESPAKWRLDAPADQKIMIGPRVTDGRQDIQPLLTKELTAYLSDQRQATEANQKAISALFEAIDALNRQQQTLARREVNKNAGMSQNRHDNGDAVANADVGVDEKSP